MLHNSLCRLSWVCYGSAHQISRRVTCAREQPAQVAQTRRCPSTPAAATAAAMYTATAEMDKVLSQMRDYYHQHQPVLHGRHQQLPPPTAADLSSVVVGVSRLVQMEFGAVHGWGECHLRDQVMRLLCGLLAVDDQDVVRSERPMGGGRSDLVVNDLNGAALLVVEFKQRNSGAASSHQQQDTMQLQRYLTDSNGGCDEGLLITFDKTLPNGLSAARLTRVVDRYAWAQLYNDRPNNAPAFMRHPMHKLESDPLAVGVMMGLCQAYSVRVLEVSA